MSSQWIGLRQNLGEWQGSLTRLSPAGEEQQSIPSILKLEEVASDQIRLMLTRMPPSQNPIQIEQWFQYPGPDSDVCFFENGACSQGTSQWSTSLQCGAEFSFIQGDRRLRLVKVFQPEFYTTSQLQYLTLIREQRVGVQTPEFPALTVADLLGKWLGQGYKLNSNRASIIPVRSIWQLSPGYLIQRFQFGQESPELFHSPLQPMPLQIVFKQSSQIYQILCMPGGAYCCCPMTIRSQFPFFLEVGWYSNLQHRQRLIRRYNAGGEWISLIWLQESRQDIQDANDSA